VDLGVAGRVALVTAASKGLGRAAAVALAQEGAKVVICARGAEALASARAELESYTEALSVQADVTEPAVPAQLVQTAVDRFGRLDIVVANAGGPPAARSLDVDDAQLEAALNANLLTSVRLVREAVPHMRAGGWGRICLLTSSSIKQPIPTLALSNTARTALWAWAKTAASDLFDDGITMNLICPGSHSTDRMKDIKLTGPVGDPVDFGRVVAFLCSQPANFISGSTVLVDGGRAVGLV